MRVRIRQFGRLKHGGRPGWEGPSRRSLRFGRPAVEQGSSTCATGRGNWPRSVPRPAIPLHARAVAHTASSRASTASRQTPSIDAEPMSPSPSTPKESGSSRSRPASPADTSKAPSPHPPGSPPIPRERGRVLPGFLPLGIHGVGVLLASPFNPFRGPFGPSAPFGVGAVRSLTVSPLSGECPDRAGLPLDAYFALC